MDNTLAKIQKNTRSLNQSIFTVEIQSRNDRQKMLQLKHLNKMEVEVTPNTSFTIQKGLIYVYSYNMNDFEYYKQCLKEKYNLQDVTRAEWIKARNSSAVPLLLNFRIEMPGFLEIPGEKTKTQVYEYKKKPLFCTKCLS